jgi:hypothetical protein
VPANRATVVPASPLCTTSLFVYLRTKALPGGALLVGIMWL